MGILTDQTLKVQNARGLPVRILGDPGAVSQVGEN